MYCSLFIMGLFAHFICMRQATVDSSRAADVKPRIVDTTDKTKSWKFTDIADSSQFKTLKLPDSLTASKV